MVKTYIQIIRFAIAGVVGFAVDTGVLYIALALEFGPYVGRFVSFLCAAFVTWQINRRITFSQRTDDSLWREWYHYLVAMSFGGGCNYMVYVAALKLLPGGAVAPVLAVAAGSVAGMFVNFTTAKLWVFKSNRPQTPR